MGLCFARPHFPSEQQALINLSSFKFILNNKDTNDLINLIFTWEKKKIIFELILHELEQEA